MSLFCKGEDVNGGEDKSSMREVVGGKAVSKGARRPGRE